MRSTKKIRQTGDLIFFNESVQEETSVKSTPKVFLKKSNATSTPFGSSTRLLRSANKVYKSGNDESVNIKLQLDDKENSSENKKSKRKIVKARRVLKIRDKNDVVADYPPVEEVQKSVENKLAAVESESNYIPNRMILTDECKLPSPINPTVKDSLIKKEESVVKTPKSLVIQINDDESGKSEAEKSNNAFLSVKTLPSPISPSLNSTTDNIEILQFNSSKEDLHPSTKGIVEPLRRRTYELEDSVNDISLLKSVSKLDQAKMSISSTGSGESSDDHTTKVTVRRKRWDKNKFSPSILDSPIYKNLNESLLKSNKKSNSKVKIPNFAAIHQKALDKMESIDEYKERKEKRAQMLLSGRKPEVDELPKSLKQSRKQLRFAPDTHEKEKSPTFIPLPSTPLPKNRVLVSTPFKIDEDAEIQNEKVKIPPVFEKPKTGDMKIEKKIYKTPPVFEKKTFKWVLHKKEPRKTPKVEKIGTPYKKAVNPPLFKFSNEKRDKSFEKKPLTVKNNIPQGQKISEFKFNFKSNVNEVKSVVTKSKTVMNTLESRRCAIKGVRSNRRFELLMNMRKGK